MVPPCGESSLHSWDWLHKTRDLPSPHKYFSKPIMYPVSAKCQGFISSFWSFQIHKQIWNHRLQEGFEGDFINRLIISKTRHEREGRYPCLLVPTEFGAALLLGCWDYPFWSGSLLALSLLRTGNNIVLSRLGLTIIFLELHLRKGGIAVNQAHFSKGHCM